MSSRRPSAKQRQVVTKRAKSCCEYCLIPAKYVPRSFALDHIIPFSKGGRTELENLALACGCNDFKKDLTHAHDPKSGRLVPLFNPRRQKWPQHFAWSDDLLYIIGRTATGRATVDTLRLNREELVSLRSVLLIAGKHPLKMK